MEFLDAVDLNSVKVQLSIVVSVLSIFGFGYTAGRWFRNRKWKMILLSINL